MKFKECNIKLSKNENIIYNSIFKINLKNNNDKNDIKSKVLFTDKGRLIFERKKNILAPVEVLVYDSFKKNKKLRVTFQEGNVVYINTKDFTKNLNLQIEFSIKLNDFIKLYKNLKINPFALYNKGFAVSIDNKEFLFAIIELERNYIKINKEIFYKKEILSYILIGNSLKFTIKDNLMNEKNVEIYSLDKDFDEVVLFFEKY